MNILITAPSLRPLINVSGISTVVKGIIDHNLKHHYYHFQTGGPDKRVSMLLRLLQIMNQLAIFPWILKRNKIELMHLNLPFDPKGLFREFLFNQWCRLLKVPVVLHVHGGVFLMNGTTNLLYKWMAKSLFKTSKVVLVLSELEKEALKIQFNYSNARVLYNSIDVELFKNNSKILSGTKPVILFLGRIHESKGIEDIIEAFSLMKAKLNFRFVLCGTGPLKDHFINKCEQLLGSDFEFRGIVSGDEKLEIIRESTFFLLPSRYGEGLPMALLETMAAGVIPIVTDDASMKYIVQSDFNGIRVNKNDPKDIAEKFILMMQQHPKWKTISQNAQNTIVEKYDINNYIKELNKIYQLALQ